MDVLKKWFKSELTGWTKWSVAWLIIATSIIVGLSIYGHDNWMSFCAAVSGVWCVILTGMGKRSSFILGLINIIFYGILSYYAKYYGEVMLNFFYFLPMNIWGWFAWKKHMNEKSGEVIKRKLGLKKSVLIYALTAISIFIYGLILKKLGGNLPYMDSMSTVVSVVAQILSIRRLREQWVLWIVVDVVTVIMWAVHVANHGDGVATLTMWCVYLVNACIMYGRWYRETKNHAV